MQKFDSGSKDAGEQIPPTESSDSSSEHILRFTDFSRLKTGPGETTENQQSDSLLDKIMRGEEMPELLFRRERHIRNLQLKRELLDKCLGALSTISENLISIMPEDDLLGSHGVACQAIDLAHRIGAIEAHQSIANKYRLLKAEMKSRGLIKV